VDARYPERWLTDRRVLRLSDPAHRLFVTALVWSVANRSDGVITDEDLELLPRVDSRCVWELADAALWLRALDSSAWLITDYEATQTTRDDLDRAEQARRAARDKKRRQRSSRGRPGGRQHGDVPEDTTRQGKAKARQGGLEEGDDSEQAPAEHSAPDSGCSDCGSPGMLLAGEDGLKRCRRCHFGAPVVASR